jgi:hypothetical protein
MNELPINPGDDDFEDDIVRALLRNGAAFPTTSEEVREAKKRLVQSKHQLPSHLRDSAEVCKRLLQGDTKTADNVVQMPLNEFAEAKEELMRAARNGKEALSARVEDKMRANRTKAKVSNG